MPRVKDGPSEFDLPWDPGVVARPEPHTDRVQATFHDKPEAKMDKLKAGYTPGLIYHPPPIALKSGP